MGYINLTVHVPLLTTVCSTSFHKEKVLPFISFHTDEKPMQCSECGIQGPVTGKKDGDHDTSSSGSSKLLFDTNGYRRGNQECEKIGCGDCLQGVSMNRTQGLDFCVSLLK